MFHSLRWLSTPSGVVSVAAGAFVAAAVLVDSLAWLVVPGTGLLALLLARLAVTESAGRVALRDGLARTDVRREELESSISDLVTKLSGAQNQILVLEEAIARERVTREEEAAAFGDSLAASIDLSEASLAEARAAWERERSDRSLIIARSLDPHLPVTRVLLQMTVHRSGSTRLFDLLRTHPAVRLSPTMEIWHRLELRGRRYPTAFSDVPGAWLPVEIETDVGAAIPDARQPDLPAPLPEDRWLIEKAHPQFTDFDALRLATNVAAMRAEGVDVMIVHGVRRPLDTMWSMFDFRVRQPSWYSSLRPQDIPAWILRSLESIRELRDLSGGVVVDYDDLPDGDSLRVLGSALAPDWNDADLDEWLEFAIGEVDPSRRVQQAGAGFMGDRSPNRDLAGPDGLWTDLADVIDAAESVYASLFDPVRPAGLAAPSDDRRSPEPGHP